MNKSKIARELGVDCRTVSKYIDGYSKIETRERISKINQHYDEIDYLLNKQPRYSSINAYYGSIW